MNFIELIIFIPINDMNVSDTYTNVQLLYVRHYNIGNEMTKVSLGSAWKSLVEHFI